MRRSAVPLLLGSLALVLVAVLAYALSRSDPGESRQRSLDAKVEAGQPVPAPGSDRTLLPVTEGVRKRLADYRGQVVVLNFWGSWCDPCKKEAPLLERYHQRLTKAKVGTVLGVTYKDTPEDSREFEREYGLTYPSFRDPGSDLAQEYGAAAMPETFILDREGRIHAIARTAVNQEFMDSALERAGVPKGTLAR
ncbi:TlpA family protein disulfide reductase [Patulibacter americanus]|uniref:TlpA family protein disulfide reductase n=1 Tax=Patulibacter americanus TaxID=588672 RepID=UPI0003B4F071|nr:TlpA disulfide reductase family protein [Patulibacter americanus]